MYPGAQTRRPFELRIQRDRLGAVGGDGIVGFFGRNREAPNGPLPWTVRIRVIDLVDSPVVRRSRHQTLREGKSGKADDEIDRGLVAPEDVRVSRAVVHRVETVAEVHIVRNGEVARLPGHVGPRIRVHGAIFRNGIVGLGEVRRSTVEQALDMPRRQNPAVDAEIIQPTIEVSISGVLRPAKPVLSRLTEIAWRVSGRCVFRDNVPIEVQRVGAVICIQSHRHMMPPAGQCCRGGRLVLVTASRNCNGETHCPPCTHSGSEEHVERLVDSKVENALPGAPLVGKVHPRRKGGVRQRTEQRADRQFDIIPVTVELQRAVQISDNPLWITEQGAVITVAGAVGCDGSRILIESPVAHKVG